MTDERLGRTHGTPGEAAGGPPVDESALEPYVVRERPMMEFLADQAQRAPWWAISFLVHLLVLLVLWKWPVPAGAVTITMDPIDVDIYRKLEVPVAEPPKRDEPPPVIDDQELEIVEPQVAPEAEVDPEDDEDVSMPEVPDDPGAPEVPLLHPPIFFVPIPTTGPARRDDVFINRRKWRLGPYDPKTSKPRIVGITELMAGLRWLAKAQERDGSWNAQAWDGAKPYPVGMTGLSLLAFLGAGFTHQQGHFKTTIGRGLQWLRTHQREDGSFPWQTFYEQGIATIAVVEAYALTKHPQIGRMAQRAVDYICAVQPEHGGFRYGGAVPKGEGDMSVTGWQIMALKSAQCAGLDVPPQAIERSRAFLQNALREYGGSSYIISSPSAGSLAMTSVGMLCRMFMDEDDVYEAEIRQAATYLLGKEAEDGQAIYGGASKQLVNDLYYTYYSSLAMFQAGGEYWRLWQDMYRDPLRLAVVKRKFDARGRYLYGSWDPAKCRWGKAGGRVYSTAMAVLSLEVPFRYLRVYRFKS